MENIEAMTFDELAAKWADNWPGSFFQIDHQPLIDGSVRWRCVVKAPVNTPSFFPPGGVGDSPTEALRNIWLALFDQCITGSTPQASQIRR